MRAFVAVLLQGAKLASIVSIVAVSLQGANITRLIVSARLADLAKFREPGRESRVNFTKMLMKIISFSNLQQK